MRKRILVVEDDEPTQRLLSAILQRQELDIVIAGGGRQAIEHLGTETFDVVLLDMMMPDLPGSAVIDYVREQRLTVPIIVCTAAGNAIIQSIDSEIVRAVIRKPFEILDLVTSVRAVAGMNPAISTDSRVLIIDDDLRARYIIKTLVSPASAVEAEDAHAALALIREQRPDVVLLDLTLPGGTPGEELLVQIRNDAATSDIPVIIVTSRKLSEDERDRLLVHAAGVIYKGDLSRETLGGALRQVLANAANAS
jgi:CheY-like chemotaxis protein